MLRNTLRSTIEELLALTLPCYCIGCHRRLRGRRKMICHHCFEELPRYRSEGDYFNVQKRLAGWLAFTEYQSSLIFARHNATRPLIHAIKYQGFPELAQQLSHHFAVQHLAAGHFVDCTAIVPVPLTPERMKRRGYNQSLYIAQGLSEVYQLPIYDHLLYRHSSRATQTRRGREERWQKMQGNFFLSDLAQSLDLANERLLLVDDLLTTGSTLIHSGRSLLEAGIESLSLYTLALDVLE